MTSALSSVALGLAAAIVGRQGALGLGGRRALLGRCLVWSGRCGSRWASEPGTRAPRLSTAALRGYVLKVGYYLLFGAVSRTGSSLDLRLGTSEVSRWIPRSATIDRRCARSAIGGRRRTPAGVARCSRDASSRTAGKAWTVCLMPVMLLLLVLRDEAQESAPPSSTYTLF